MGFTGFNMYTGSEPGLHGPGRHMSGSDTWKITAGVFGYFCSTFYLLEMIDPNC